MQINRFPKMAALQKYRALKLGYPEDLAEALGIAEALKYAIFKRFFVPIPPFKKGGYSTLA